MFVRVQECVWLWSTHLFAFYPDYPDKKHLILSAQ